MPLAFLVDEHLRGVLWRAIQVIDFLIDVAYRSEASSWEDRIEYIP